LPSRSETPGRQGGRSGAALRRLSGAPASGIPKEVQINDGKRLLLLATLAMGALASSCTIRGLAHDELFGPPDGSAMEAGSDVTPDTDDVGVDAVDTGIPGDVVEPTDAADVDAAEIDALTDASVVDADAGPGPDLVVACTATSCPADQFCDDLTQRCTPRTGSGMLSGIAFNMCDHKNVDARVGIAGQHQCTAAQKGSYYFHVNVPFGMLTLSAAAQGYKVFSKTVVIVPGGNVQDIAMIPDTPNGCADPTPVPVPCTCTDAACSPN
jgi:hypothetical protein